jgi:plasmid maintenance system killer protein
LIEISYSTNALRKVCEDAEVATKKYGAEMARKIHQRIDEIRAATSVEMLVQFRIGRCHPLTGDRKGQYAMDLTHPYRLVFEKRNGKLVAVEILEIVDYH